MYNPFKGRFHKDTSEKQKVHRFNMEDNAIIKCMDFFIDFLDASLIRICSLLLLVGFVMGTVSVLSPAFNLAGVPMFNLIWSIVQAVALDGLFIGVLSRIRECKIQQESCRWYIGVAFLLGIVAAMINSTLALQELSHTTTEAAMQSLGISPVMFVYLRAFLVVVVTVLVVTLPRTNRYIESLRETIALCDSDLASLENKIACQENEFTARIEMLQSQLETVNVRLIEETSHSKRLAQKAESLERTGLEDYPLVITELIEKNEKTASLEKIASLTGHTKAQLRKAPLERYNKNKELVRVSSLVEWLKNAPKPEYASSNGHSKIVSIKDYVELEA